MGDEEEIIECSNCGVEFDGDDETHSCIECYTEVCDACENEHMREEHGEE